MAVWKRSTRRRGSYSSSSSSAGSGCYKPTSPAQASTAPSKANLPVNYRRNESRCSEVNYSEKRKYTRSSGTITKRRLKSKHLVVGLKLLKNELNKKRGRPSKYGYIPNEIGRINSRNEKIKKQGQTSKKIFNDIGLKKIKNEVIKKRGRPPKSVLLDDGLNNLKNGIMKKRGRRPNKPALISDGLNKLKSGFIKKRGVPRKNQGKIRAELYYKNKEIIIKKRGRPSLKNLANLRGLDYIKNGMVRKRGRPSKVKHVPSNDESNNLKKDFMILRNLSNKHNKFKRNHELWKDTNNGQVKKRGRPPRHTICHTEWNNVKNGRVKKSCSIIRITKHSEWIGVKNGFTRKRGRPRKDSSMYDYICQHHQVESAISEPEDDRYLVASTSQSDQSEMSEYEKLRIKRREEMLSMFRELFSVETETVKPEENNILKRRKYCRRPLPPSRPRSLRLQGLSPGQRPLRNRAQSNSTTAAPRCLCCCRLPQQNNVNNINSNVCQA